jgi:hypothetical protein
MNKASSALALVAACAIFAHGTASAYAKPDHARSGSKSTPTTSVDDTAGSTEDNTAGSTVDNTAGSTVDTTASLSTSTTYVDDTHASIAGSVVALPGQDYGYTRYKYDRSKNSATETIDARLATFHIANSKNSNPTESQPCSVGTLPTQTYPVQIYNADNARFVGGLVIGHVPQSSDWRYTYCNSQALFYKYALNGSFDGVRITSSWDTFGEDSSSGTFNIMNNWATGVRDDFYENDSYRPGTVDDNLVDGTFQFLSMAGSSDSSSASRTIPVTGNVVRIKASLYKGTPYFGAILKGNSYSQRMDFRNNVIAVDAPTGSTWSSYWSGSWSKMSGSCSNNLFLWMSDRAIPSSVGTIPACFTVLKGAEARAKWAAVKQNWINCHPKLRRESTDPVSRPAECKANTFGGYT